MFQVIHLLYRGYIYRIEIYICTPYYIYINRKRGWKWNLEQTAGNGREEESGMEGSENKKDGMQIREKDVEHSLVEEAKRRHGIAFKFVSPGLNGVPDRLVLLPGGHVGFVEVKRPGGRMRPLQKRRKRQIEVLGIPVFCVDRKEKIGEVLDAIQTT